MFVCYLCIIYIYPFTFYMQHSMVHWAAHLFLKHSGLHVVAHSFAFLSSDLYIYIMCEGKKTCLGRADWASEIYVTQFSSIQQSRKKTVYFSVFLLPLNQTANLLVERLSSLQTHVGETRGKTKLFSLKIPFLFSYTSSLNTGLSARFGEKQSCHCVPERMKITFHFTVFSQREFKWAG